MREIGKEYTFITISMPLRRRKWENLGTLSRSKYKLRNWELIIMRM